MYSTHALKTYRMAAVYFAVLVVSCTSLFPLGNLIRYRDTDSLLLEQTLYTYGVSVVFIWP